jgi:hypothetical protein
VSDLARQHADAPPPLLATLGLRRPVPAYVEAIAMRCLEKRPEDRFASADELLGELRGALQHLVSVRERSRGSPTDEMPLPPVPREALSTRAQGPALAPPRDRERASTEAALAPTAIAAAVSPPAPRPLPSPPVERRGVRDAAALQAVVERGIGGDQGPTMVSLPVAGAPRPSAWPWFIALGVTAMLAAAAGVAMSLFARRGEVAPAAAPPEQVVVPIPDPPRALPEVRATFDSTPRGATVEEEGTVLGVTPFLLSFPPSDPDHQRVFIFRLGGHHPVTVQTTMSTARVSVRAALEERQDGRTDDTEEVERLREVARRVTRGRRAPKPISRPVTGPAALEAEVEVELPQAPALADPPVEVSPLGGEIPGPTAAPAPPPPAPDPDPSPVSPSGPRKVPTHVLEQAVRERVPIELPPRVLLAHRGEQLKIVALLCAAPDGSIDRTRTRLLSGPPDVRAPVLDALHRWKLEPADPPLCGPVHFQIDIEE